MTSATSATSASSATSPTPPVLLSPREVAAQIAARASDQAVLARAVAASARQSRYADLLPWRPAGLAQGHAGVAVLCAELDRREPGQGWDRAGHHHLSLAVAGAGPHDVSLFSGLAGVGFAALQLAAGRPRYTRLLQRIDEALAPRVERAGQQLATARGCAAQEMDLVSGLTGMGVYLLTRHQLTPGAGAGPPAEPPAGPGSSLTVALSALATLLADTGHPRRWHTPAALAAGSLREAYPGGHHNLGLAHGVPGPLALLSLALSAEVAVPRTREAIEAGATWLIAHQNGTAQQPDWPDAVDLDPGRPPAPGCGSGRAAWCYGAPGVARSMWLAGVATGQVQWQDLAGRAITAIAGRPPTTWGLSTPTFCHGSAGLLQVLNRFAAERPDPAVAAAAAALAGQLAAGFEPTSVLGVRGVEPDGVLVDHPGLLDGAPGVALPLLGVRAPRPGAGEPGWDRMFLLS